MGNSMPVSSKNFWGTSTSDLKVVERYAAYCKARGIAVYFDEEYQDKEDGEYYCKGREDQDGNTCPIYHNGKFIGVLYDAADEDLANRGLAYRDRYRAERLAKAQADSEARAIEDPEIKGRCKASGCVRKWGEPCKNTLKFSPCPERLRYREEKEIEATYRDVMMAHGAVSFAASTPSYNRPRSAAYRGTCPLAG